MRVAKGEMSMLFSFLFVLVLLNLSVKVSCINTYSRGDFPTGFIFGAATSAYQVEGAAKEDGRTPSVWDTFAYEGHYKNGETGDVAVDQYHKYKEDVQLMVDTRLDAYRFSISWSRLIPNGRGAVNPKALQYYNNLINELIGHGIQPHVSLFNFDHPQALEDEYGGWISPKILKDFTAYAEVCFREFGDRVSHWTTINEPNIFAIGGYDQGMSPPGRCSTPFGFNCSRGNSTYEPYLAGHHMLLAHALTVRLYKEKFQGVQRGLIGLTLYISWLEPLTNSTDDMVATKRALDFFLGWFMNPMVFGDYPEIMKKIVGSRLPTLTTAESEFVKGAFDFIGVIHYNSMKIKDNPDILKLELRDFNADMAVFLKGTPFDNSSSFELPIAPQGLQGVLEHFKLVYGNPPIYIHENGQRTKRTSILEDTSRVEYLQEYIGAMLDTIRNGSNTLGYFMWSFLDLFELLEGNESSYGLYYVDLEDPDLKRYPKLSAHWYSNLLKGGSVGLNGTIELERNASNVNFGRLFR